MKLYKQQQDCLRPCLSEPRHTFYEFLDYIFFGPLRSARVFWEFSKIIIGLDSFSNQRLIYLVSFELS